MQGWALRLARVKASLTQGWALEGANRSLGLEVGAKEERYHGRELARSRLHGCLLRAVSGGATSSSLLAGSTLPAKWRRLARTQTLHRAAEGRTFGQG